MRSICLYLSPARATCFDGETTTETGTTPTTVVGTVEKTLTQEQFNKALAEDKRKHQAQLAKVESDYKVLLDNKNLTEAETNSLKETLTTLQSELRTKEETLLHDKKQAEEKYKNKLSEVEKEKSSWEGRYKQETIERAITDAAATGEAYRPSQVVNELRPFAKLMDIPDPKTGKASGRFKVVVELPEIDPTTKEEVIKTFSPDDAIKYMKDRPAEYGNMFKSNVVPGIGSHSGSGGPTVNGNVDWKSMTPEQYIKLSKEQPELVYGK